jgi:hypothetical protein
MTEQTNKKPIQEQLVGEEVIKARIAQCPNVDDCPDASCVKCERNIRDYVEFTIKELQSLGWKTTTQVTIMQNLEKDSLRKLFDTLICPMCYRLNPQHATMDNGKGCHSCKDRENWCGKQEFLGEGK